MSNRVGGMDYYYWLFDSECKKLNYHIIWVFPNHERFSEYSNLEIICPLNNQSIEAFFCEYCKQNNIVFDVVLTHFLELCTSFFKQLRPFSKKTIVVDHNPRPLNGYSLKKRIIKKIKGSLYSKYINIFIGVSQYTKNEIINNFGKLVVYKTEVIYNGILTSNYKKREKKFEKKPSFLVVSHLRESKGIQDLIEAASLLSPEIKKNLKIDVFGEGPFEKELKLKVIAYSLQSTFNFKGSVSNLYEMYAQYDYLLQPTHMECFSLSILESLCANVPVITTNVGGNEEVVSNQKNGFIFEAKNSKALSKIIENLILGKISIQEDTSELIRTSFTIEKMVQHYINIL
jgi:L-malate glycosyltransferase